jgi:cytochrome c peroxidase
VRHTRPRRSAPTARSIRRTPATCSSSGSRTHRRTLSIALTLAALLGACGANPPTCDNAKLPAGPPAIGGRLPDLDLLAVDGAGRAFTEHLRSGCAGGNRILVIRVGAAWCGTCRWHATHVLGESVRAGTHDDWLDVLVADEDNRPAGGAALTAWLADGRDPRDSSSVIAADPDRRMVPAQPMALPIYLLVDDNTLGVLDILSNPGVDALFAALARAREKVGEPGPIPPDPDPLVDGRFNPEDHDLIAAMGNAPGAPPRDPTNDHADDAGAAALGRALFFDAALSPSGKVACASCHDPMKQLADGLPRSTGGVLPVDRNAPAIALAAHQPWQFWDGRADSLWSQALGPFENAREFKSSRLFVDHVIAARYADAFQAVWGPLPDLADAARFPPSGAPGTPEWQAMAAADQDAATRVFVDAGKSIAAFERTLRVVPSALDRYAGGDAGALTARQKDGLLAFLRAGCAQCHFGPRLTDDAFHAARFPTGRTDGVADRGRIDGAAALVGGEFTAQSAWSDHRVGARVAGLVALPSMLGQFKTPALRGVAGSAPYGHGGTLATLDDVLALHGAGLPPSSPAAVGDAEPWLLAVDPASRAAVADFLGTLTAAPMLP